MLKIKTVLLVGVVGKQVFAFSVRVELASVLFNGERVGDRGASALEKLAIT